jgi:hypothetical protein
MNLKHCNWARQILEVGVDAGRRIPQQVLTAAASNNLRRSQQQCMRERIRETALREYFITRAGHFIWL